MSPDEAPDQAMADAPLRFEPPLHVGQLNIPPFAEFREAFEDIFARRFFANHGPLEQELDQALAGFLGVRNAISVVNGTAALMLVLKALGVQGEVITTAFTFPATVQAVVWAGLEPVFCDVDPVSHMLTAPLVEARIGPRTAAILGVHVWGRGCDPLALEDLARSRGLRLIFDAAHATGCTFAARRIGGFGDAEIFSFHATKILNGGEGGCITTNDDDLAERLRTMRSFHDRSTADPGLLRLNAKLSEAQAAMALLGLRHLPERIEDNRRRYELYRRELAGIPGLTFLDYAAGEQSNRQFVVTAVRPSEFGLTRDQLQSVLQERQVLARQYFAPGVHRTPPFCDAGIADLPVTDQLCETLLQLPTGQAITLEHVRAICGIIRAAARGASGPRQDARP